MSGSVSPWPADGILEMLRSILGRGPGSVLETLGRYLESFLSIIEALGSVIVSSGSFLGRPGCVLEALGRYLEAFRCS